MGLKVLLCHQLSPLIPIITPYGTTVIHSPLIPIITPYGTTVIHSPLIPIITPYGTTVIHSPLIPIITPYGTTVIHSPLIPIITPHGTTVIHSPLIPIITPYGTTVIPLKKQKATAARYVWCEGSKAMDGPLNYIKGTIICGANVNIQNSVKYLMNICIKMSSQNCTEDQTLPLRYASRSG